MAINYGSVQFHSISSDLDQLDQLRSACSTFVFYSRFANSSKRGSAIYWYHYAQYHYPKFDETVKALINNSEYPFDKKKITHIACAKILSELYT